MDVRYILYYAVSWFSNILSFFILARCILSWLPISRDNPIVRFVRMMTEPILGPIRNLIAKSPLGGAGMMIDFSPMISIFLIEIVGNLLMQLILSV